MKEDDTGEREQRVCGVKRWTEGGVERQEDGKWEREQKRDSKRETIRSKLDK